PHVIVRRTGRDSVKVETSPHFRSSASQDGYQEGKWPGETKRQQQQLVAHDGMDQGFTAKLEKGAWPESSGEAEPWLETASIVQATSRWTASPVIRQLHAECEARVAASPAGNLTFPSLRFQLVAKMLTCKARASAAPSRPVSCHL
ncbi:hypothetical protein BBK36DRAFT_1188841, partial [Trichoderma citrinoviride]